MLNESKILIITLVLWGYVFSVQYPQNPFPPYMIFPWFFLIFNVIFPLKKCYFSLLTSCVVLSASRTECWEWTCQIFSILWFKILFFFTKRCFKYLWSRVINLHLLVFKLFWKKVNKSSEGPLSSVSSFILNEDKNLVSMLWLIKPLWMPTGASGSSLHFLLLKRWTAK